ncbi:MAG: GNAT family N-acetyltransferase [Bryobacteraceae bacterium]
MKSDILEVRELRQEEVHRTPIILARGMRDNPNHIQVFGSDPDRRQAALFQMFCPVMPRIHGKGAVLGAFLSGSLVGVCGMTEPGCCQPSLMDKLRIIPQVARGNSFAMLQHFLQWTSKWSSHDPRHQHWHLGPIAVDRHLQGKGIGGSMMKMFCLRMDELSVMAHLETDKHENIRFYERFGFEVVSEDMVVGVKNWFMQRPAC